MEGHNGCPLCPELQKLKQLIAWAKSGGEQDAEKIDGTLEELIVMLVEASEHMSAPLVKVLQAKQLNVGELLVLAQLANVVGTAALMVRELVKHHTAMGLAGLVRKDAGEEPEEKGASKPGTPMDLDELRRLIDKNFGTG